MAITPKIQVALVGNPNAGKSTIFNQLTGLNQKVGNFPGVTVEKKVGQFQVNAQTRCVLTDLPGTYSLYPKSPDEKVVFEALNPKDITTMPDVVVVVADASNLKRNLLLFSQVADLGLPCVLVLNMIDVAEKNGLHIDVKHLSQKLGIPVIKVNGRSGEGIDKLKSSLMEASIISKPILDVSSYAPALIEEIKTLISTENTYKAFQLAHQFEQNKQLSEEQSQKIADLVRKYQFKGFSFQTAETISRYSAINTLLQGVVEQAKPSAAKYTKIIDGILVHRVGGYLTFLAILFLIFQAIFSWAQYPMDIIDGGIAQLNDWLSSILPEGPATSLLTEGVIAGLGGVLIFIPQIAILSAFIAILEETGYMARVVFIMDRLMRPFGLNGKSVVPLISGVACAVPAIMATRNIENTRDRLVTIFVTPLMSCSARIPVFTVLIALMVPATSVWGVFNVQGVVLMGLYLLGFLAALLSAVLFKNLFKVGKRSFFVMELPPYKSPRWANVGLTVIEKTKAFVMEAGKVILAISVILWVMASYGPSGEMERAEQRVSEMVAQNALPEGVTEEMALKSAQLEASYAGLVGKAIEPAIKPLGFDWKIGIALVTSFAAREVFIGTMATIYSLGDTDEENTNTVISRMRVEKHPVTGEPFYSVALCASLLVFYLFAMQCMSTLAVTYRETKGWIYPALQLFYMTGLAYLCSLLVYNLLG